LAQLNENVTEMVLRRMFGALEDEEAYDDKSEE
jgi:hypothetical protein